MPIMSARHALAAAVAAVATLAIVPGCAVTRGQENVKEYVSDASITTAIKGKFIENKTVAASSIGVETLDGTVMLTGFAKNDAERMTAEQIARGVIGVRQVKNKIVVRPG